MTNPLLDAALGYAARGWPVLPLHSWTGRCSCGDGQCGSPAKHPRTGHGLRDATTEVATIEGWWRTWPDANVGVRCDRLCVIDIDGPGGVVALQDLGIDPDLHPCVSQTGMGRHLLFQGHPDARPKTRVLPEVDVRAGSGSYIVAPPSVHWTGAVYDWKTQDGEPPPLPATIRPVLGLREAGERPATVRDPGPSNGHAPATSDSPLEQLVATLTGVGEGRRHDTALRLCGRMARLGLREDETLAWLRLWAEHCSPPLPDPELRRIVQDIFRSDRAKEGDRVVDEAPPAVLADQASPWRGVEAWLAEKPPAMRWLLRHPDRDGKPCAPREGDGMLARGSVGILTAEGGAGKTTALLQLGIALLTGRPWLGHFHTPAPWGPERGRVCLLLAEDSTEDAWRRVHYTAANMGLTPDERAQVGQGMVVIPLAGYSLNLLRQVDAGSDVLETDDLRELRTRLRHEAEADDLGWSLIGIDPLARVAGIDAEGDNTLATKLIQTVETFTAVPGGPTALMLAHSSKFSRRIGEADSRGVTGLTDGARWHGTLTVKGAEVEFRQRKSNHSRPMDEGVPLARRNGVLVLAPRIEEGVAAALASGMARVLEALRDMGGRAASSNSLAANVPGKRTAVLSWIAEAAARGIITALPGPRRSCGYVLPAAGTSDPENRPQNP